MENIAKRFNTAKRALFNKLYADLNEKQREAVFTVDGPLLVLAGAGSGKTTVLVRRIGFIIRYGDTYNFDHTEDMISEQDVLAMEAAINYQGELIEKFLEKYRVSPCPPWAVLAITFTNKAANEMKERLAKLNIDNAEEIWAGTFHSICVKILRRFGDRIGFEKDFTIYDSDDSKKLISNIYKEMNIDEKRLPIKTTMNAISRAKDSLMTPSEFMAEMKKDFTGQYIARVYEKYEQRLAEANAVDFDNIIVKTVKLFEECPDVLEFYQHRFRYVCVDEYQDTNKAQFRLAALISGGYKNIMVVGDDDQSIYRFRGATIENILTFDKSFSNSKIVKLEQNYRSTSHILKAANSVIANNSTRHGKNLWTSREGGEKVTLRNLGNQNDEASYIAQNILKLSADEEREFSDFAVLYRMNAQSNAIERALTKSGVPYKVFGGLRFYDRKEIKDILAYLCLVQNTGDNLRLQRIINEPKRKIGSTTVMAVAEIAAQEGKSMFDVIKNAREYTALKNAAAKLVDFSNLISTLQGMKDTMKLSEFFTALIDMTGYRQMLVDMKEEGKEKIELVEELVSSAVDYENEADEATLAGFLEEVALVSDIDGYEEDEARVTLMTIHSAKGLEFPVVFLPGLENGIFPSMNSQASNEEMEEERRLAYVAITRAKEKLFITHTSERLLYGRTQYNPISQFVKEIPDEVLDKIETIKRKPTFASFDDINGMSAFNKNVSYNVRPMPKADSNDFVPGDRVRHMTFGEGTILSTKKMGSDTLYEIMFDEVGTKKLMKTYAKLTLIK